MLQDWAGKVLRTITIGDPESGSVTGGADCLPSLSTTGWSLRPLPRCDEFMPEDNGQPEELEKLVNENRKAFERAKRLLEEAKRKARRRPSDSAPTVTEAAGDR
jgi:hypothetical protein